MGRIVLKKRPIFRTPTDFSDCTYQYAWNATAEEIYTTSPPSRNSNLLKPTGYVMHQQFNIQQLYALPTLYLCVLYLSENKQRPVPLTA